MAADHFDHLFVQPAAFDAALAFYRDVLGWALEFAWGTRWFVVRDPDGNLIAFEQRG